MESSPNYLFQSSWKLSKDLRRDVCLLIADYSAGKSLRYLANRFYKILNHDDNSTSWNLYDDQDYYLSISMSSLAVLLKAENRIQASKLFPHNDFLISYILGRRDAHHYSIKTKMPLYHGYKDLIVNPTSVKLENLIKLFYSSFGNVKWFNSHLKKHHLFFGYWSFALPVLVEKLKLDDKSIRDHMFYPRDLLVNKPLLKSWENSDAGKEARHELDFQLDTNLNTNTLLFDEIFDFYESYLIEIRNGFLRNEFKVRIQHSIEVEERKKLLFDIAEALRRLKDMKIFDHEITQKQFISSIQNHFQINFDDIELDGKKGLSAITEAQKAKDIKNNQIKYLNLLAEYLINLDGRFEFADLSFWFQLDELLVNQNLD